jgi:hypothetical protein
MPGRKCGMRPYLQLRQNPDLESDDGEAVQVHIQSNLRSGRFNLELWDSSVGMAEEHGFGEKTMPV